MDISAAMVRQQYAEARAQLAADCERHVQMREPIEVSQRKGRRVDFFEQMRRIELNDERRRQRLAAMGALVSSPKPKNRIFSIPAARSFSQNL